MNVIRKTKPKRLISMLLALCMVLTLLPTVAFAGGSTPAVKIGGTTLESGKYYTVNTDGTLSEPADAKPTDGTGYAHWDGDNKALTLNSFEYTAPSTTAEKNMAIEITGGDCAINMKGNSNVTVSKGGSGNRFQYAIYSDSALTFTGGGTLTADGGISTNSFGVEASGVKVLGGILNAKSDYGTTVACGLYADNVQVKGGTLNATGGEVSIGGGRSTGIIATNVTVADGKLNATSKMTSGQYAGLEVGKADKSGSITVSGNGELSGISIGVWCDITVSDSSKLSTNALYIPKHKITIDDGAVIEVSSRVTCDTLLGFGTISGSITATNALTRDKNGNYTVKGNITLPDGKNLTIDTDKTLTVENGATLTGPVVNNGSLNLPEGTTADAIKVMNLTGDGLVKVSEDTYLNDGTKINIPAADDPNLDENGKLDLSTAAENKSGNGYNWDAANKILTLNSFYFDNTIILPSEATVITETASSVDKISMNDNDYNAKKLTLSGFAPLTLRDLDCNGQPAEVTVSEGAEVEMPEVEGMLSGINIGTSGGINSLLTVNGKLTASNYYGAAISCGKVVIGSTGELKVSGTQGVRVNGMNPGGGDGTDYTGIFTIENGGKFIADCTHFNVMAFTSYNELAEDTVRQVIVLPDNYLPDDYAIRIVSGDNGRTQYAATIAKTNAELTLESENVYGAGGTLTLPEQVSGGGTTTTYAVTFDANGGTCTTISSMTGTDGKLTSLPTATKSGSYSFNGWYTAASGGTKITTDYLFSANTIVYAQWTYTGDSSGDGSSSGGGTTDPTEPGQTTSPQTGDNSNMILWIALMFISFGGIATACVVKRKRVRSK